MRAEDLKRLEVPIDAADTRGPTEQFLDALELGVPGARALVQAFSRTSTRTVTG